MLTFDHVTLGQRVLFGARLAIAHTVVAVRELGCNRVLLVADQSVAALADELAGAVSVVARIREVIQHVPVTNALAATELARSSAADIVVSIGGGSATGLAKVVGRETGLPIIAVPTTFAGSEATDVWGQTDGGTKQTGRDPRVLPRVVVLDPSLSRSLPLHLALASGLNAIAHAVDGFWAPQADPITVALGTEGLRAIAPSLRALHRDIDDDQARERVAYGSYLCALAFAGSGSGIHHKICHVLGGLHGLSHSEMHAVVLPHVMAFNTAHAPDAAARVQSALGSRSAAGGLSALRRDLGVVGSLSGLGMSESGIDRAAALVLAAVPARNPAPVTLTAVRDVIHAAWSGATIAGEEPSP